MNLIVPTRDAIVAAINAASPAFTPCPLAIPIWDIAWDAAQLSTPTGRMVVLAHTESRKIYSRGILRQVDVEVDVAVQFYYGATTPGPALDPWVNEAEAIAEFFEGEGAPRILANSVTIVSAPLKQVTYPEHLRSARILTTVVGLTGRICYSP